ncbi:phosphatidylglycerophosphatase A [Parvibaculum sedimenti]|uniref:Phosphatidylglycerophosphatase A n=1 Tax=Parvibaculum sedimenti TaxID=2608632 RepID=A0A6N6VL65_9HYPH|nr:phosphatidylglycerophosphatase A [Parvibaculum sedimenti]KAB7739352.1 phosphatidylglycerophosphatase A [Parvibaculum sedimenti]
MMKLTPLPAGLRFADPVALIATWFGSGLMPKAPGTWGSLAALPPALFLAWLGGPLALIIGAALAFVIGIPAASRYAAAKGTEDPSEVVIDEVAAQWLVLAALPLAPVAWGAGFLLFRFFDVVKPWPVSLADARLKGGPGIMLDDIVAAVYAILAILLIRYFTGAL